MRVVLDTNSLLVSISKKSKYRPIFDGILQGKFTLLITNEILSEYTEIIERMKMTINLLIVLLVEMRTSL